eukprot:558809-Amphidinium_carterae.1
MPPRWFQASLAWLRKVKRLPPAWFILCLPDAASEGKTLRRGCEYAKHQGWPLCGPAYSESKVKHEEFELTRLLFAT